MKRSPLKRYAPLRSCTGFRRRNKYNAVPAEVDGLQFDSKTEARRYGQLKLLQMGGVISGLEIHPKVTLIAASGGKPDVSWHPDFRYVEDGRVVFEDSKSRPADARELLLFKLWQHFGPALLRITDATGKTTRTVMGGAA